MATITPMKSGNFRVQFREKGLNLISRTFPTRSEAQSYQAMIADQINSITQAQQSKLPISMADLFQQLHPDVRQASANLPVFVRIRGEIASGELTLAQLIDDFMRQYNKKDTNIINRLKWWVDKFGCIALKELSEDHVREGLGFGPLIRMVPYVIPVALQISVPATILMSCCTVFGRMSADNEILAIKSLGISPTSVMVPAFVLAFVVSLVAVWINDIAVSWGRTGIYSVVVDSVEEVTYRMLKTQREYQTPAFSINVKQVRGRELIQPTIRVNASGGKKYRIDASKACLESDRSKSSLKFILDDVSVVHDDLRVGFEAGNRLLAAGCEHIGFIGVPDSDLAVDKLRSDGLKQALTMSGASELLFHSHGEFSIESGYANMKQLINEYPNVDGVFCATDRIAVGAIKALQEAGIEVGKQVKVLGVGNDELGYINSPSLSTFNYAFDKAGESGAKMLLELIDGTPQVMSKVVLTFQNISRHTCK